MTDQDPRRAVLLALMVFLAGDGVAAAASDAAAELFSRPSTARELSSGLLKDALDEIGRSTVVEGKFRQQRTVRKLPRPLQSTGDFLLVRQLGLRWRTLEPIQDEFVLTRQGLSLKSQQRNLPRARRIELGAVTDLMFALFSLDVDALDRRFALFGDGSSTNWQIGMRPRDRATAGAIRQVTVHGGLHVDSIAIVNTAGDELRVELLGIVAHGGEADAAQRAIFEPHSP
ncbi:MAG TPA: outer membrane lipoprotein carrier protein LolA [Steroidobacteraceae bacterium]|nr:outer membrane lipoprotein carrier protein LolA [Steroidobacteraceae bacterium]